MEGLFGPARIGAAERGKAVGVLDELAEGALVLGFVRANGVAQGQRTFQTRTEGGAFLCTYAGTGLVWMNLFSCLSFAVIYILGQTSVLVSPSIPLFPEHVGAYVVLEPF